MDKIILQTESTPEKYMELFNLPIGGIVKVDGDYETVLRRINDRIPENKEFELLPITAGTTLFTQYGCNHLIVSKNEAKII